VIRVPVRSQLIRWARERAGYDIAGLSERFAKLEEWERGESFPTLKQLEDFAKATRTPFGYFFLAQPPVERVPIPDFRTVGNALIEHPSPDLLDTIYLCQQRQEWFRDDARMTGEPPLEFVGSARRSDDAVEVANRIRKELGFSIEERRILPTWEAALRRFIEVVDKAGILVMVNGVVGSNNRRKLDPAEFRGFALADPLAPLVFINGADTKAAQMFTLAHELAHLWLGETALSDVPLSPSHDVEVWCNKVAAELLVPMTVFRNEYDPKRPLASELQRLARWFKVSTLVILRRMHDAGGLNQSRFRAEYEAELDRLRSIQRTEGGDFYLSTTARVGKRFARAVVTATWEGRASFTEAFHLLGFKKMETFRKLGQNLGVGV
jgi:Zn-dependent peptidase ImmA (M78 family)